MKNIGEKIFGRRAGETEIIYDQRIEETKRIFSDALGTMEGQRLLNLLTHYSPPFGPRFLSQADSHHAAFLDGEKHLLGLLVVHGGGGK